MGLWFDDPYRLDNPKTMIFSIFVFPLMLYSSSKNIKNFRREVMIYSLYFHDAPVSRG